MASNNDAVSESLSALLDGEHHELDLRRVLKAAESDSAVSDKWASYHLTRQIMKKELTVCCDDGFLAGIQEAIASEPAHKQKNVYSFLPSYTGKVAAAACFTFAFLIGASYWNHNGVDKHAADIASSSQVNHESVAVVPDGFELPPLTARTVSSVPSSANLPSYTLPLRERSTEGARVQEVTLNAEQQALLNRLMMKHADSSAANGGLSVMPYTRVNSVESSD